MTCVQHEWGEAQAGEDVVDEKSVEVGEGRVVAWYAGGIGVEGQRKGKRVVVVVGGGLPPLVPLPLSHDLPPSVHLVFLFSVFVNLALALALAGKRKRTSEEWRGVVGRG